MKTCNVWTAVAVALATAGCAKKDESPAVAAAPAAVAAAAQPAPPAEIVIPGERITPESLTSTADGHVIIGSVQAGTVWRAAPGSATAEAWIQPGTDGLCRACSACSPTMAPARSMRAPVPSGRRRQKVRRRRLPRCTHSTSPPVRPRPSTRFPRRAPSATTSPSTPNGNVYVTDTNNMLIGRLAKGGEKPSRPGPARMARWARRASVLDGIAVLGDRVLVNALIASKLYAVSIGADGAAGKAVEIKTDRVVERPDGMRSFGANDLLVAEGGGAGRLTRVTVTAIRARRSP